MPLADSKKWMIALYAAALFALISAPMMYKVTDRVFENIGMSTYEGMGPSWKGILLHTAAFLLLFRLILVFIK